MTMNIKIEKILSVLKSLYASYKYCKNDKFWRLPIMVRWNCRVIGHGRVIVGDGGRFIVGFGRVGIYDKHFSPSILEIEGTVSISGKVVFGQGARICVGKGAILKIGNHTFNTAEGRIICMDDITIGENVALGWETCIMDSDFHSSLDLATGKTSICHSPVVIADNVWTGQKSTILKGVHIGKGSIVAACAVVTKSFEAENVLIAGNPAMVKKTNITGYFQ